MSNAFTRILVVRVTNMDGVDPVQELETVIRLHGHAWFGKFGRPISARYLQTNRRLPLLFANRKNGTYEPEVFEIKAMQQRRPPRDFYPKYYARVLPRISTWINIVPLNDTNINLDGLQVIATGSSVRKALRDSMSAHFWCKLTAPADNHVLG